MNKWVVLTVAVMTVAGVQAAEKGKGGGMDKDKYIAVAQKRAETAGKTFDQAKAEAAFAAKDKNGDGILTADEMAPAGGKGAKKAKKTAPAAE